MLRLIAAACVVLAGGLLAGCSTSPARQPAGVELPTLRLPPAALGRELALQQRLSFEHGGRRDSIDALVEVDAASLQLVMHSQGQVALRLAWDGQTLDQQRADWLPTALSGERVLDDLQLVYWPAASIEAVLPADWGLREDDGRRELLHHGRSVVTVTFTGTAHARLQHHRQGYVLDIHSVPVTP